MNAMSYSMRDVWSGNDSFVNVCAASGPLGYWSTVVFQQVASIGNNITIQIVAGQSMWEIYLQYKGEDASGVTLQEFIIIFGAFELLLSQLPDIHSLRVVNLLCTGCTIAFTACVVGLSAKYGRSPWPC